MPDWERQWRGAGVVFVFLPAPERAAVPTR